MENIEREPAKYLTAYLETRFFGALLAMIQIVPKKFEGAIAGISVDQDKKIVLNCDPDKMNELSLAEKCFVFAHEASHIFTATHIRRGDRDPLLWNYATDAIINELLIRHFDVRLKPLRDPETGEISVVTLANLKKQKLIPKDVELGDTTADDIYNYLDQTVERIEVCGGSCAACDRNPDKDKKQGQGDGQGQEKKKQQQQQGQGQGQGQQQSESKTKKICRKMLEKLFRKIDDNKLDGANDIDEKLKQEIEALRRAAESDNYGSTTGDFMRNLGKITKPYFPFKTVLKKIFDHSKTDFSRPHRRLNLKKVYFPRKFNVKYKVYAAIDVSGSCYEYTEQFLGYIAALPQFEECYFFDTEITQTWKKGQPIPSKAKGYGGTDLNPCMKKFRELEEQNRGAQMNFVVLTDGQIPELTTGPVKSNVIVFTTDEEVHYNKSYKPYRNIKLK